MMSSKVFDKAYDYIRRNKLISEGDSVVAGVSGGADSMCMLKILLEIRERLDLKLIVAHVNHGIRGAEAERDASFVQEFCGRNSIAFELAEADIPRLASETGTTCEEAGRNFRYDFFCRIASNYGAKKIAVAHNSGDNAETVLFNIFRGSGLGGLKGILPARGIKDKGGKEYSIIRPVLILSRDEIEEYLHENGIGYCTDSTNLENDYSRNRIRNTFLPMAAQSINSNAAEHIGTLSRQAAEVYDFIMQETEKNSSVISYLKDETGDSVTVRMDGAAIDSLHPVIRKSLIRRAFEMAAGRLKDVEEVHILSIDELFQKQSGRKLSLPYGIAAIKEYEDVILVRNSDRESECRVGTQPFITLEIVNRGDLPAEIPRLQDEKWFDYDKIDGKPELRTPLEGDYLIIGKERHKKSLSRFMIDKKIPLKDRENTLLVAAGSHVLWVVGIRQDDSCFVTEETQRVLIAKKMYKKR